MTLRFSRFKANSPVLLSALVLSATFAATPCAHGQASALQVPDTTSSIFTPYAEFQYATLTGSNNTLVASMVPVVTASGVSYKDLTFQITVAANGTITIVPGSPTVVASPITATAGFKAGSYIAPSTYFDGAGLVTVSGPGVAAGGTTEWSLATAAGASNVTYPSTATWYVGSPTSTSNPLYARLKAAGITSPAYSYGVCSSYTYPYWAIGTLIGVSQAGNTITIYSFSSDDTDYSTPRDQITYTLK